MLEPDELEPERPDRRRPVRLVTTGLAPCAAVPAQRRTAEPVPCLAPCEASGARVLVGRIASGQRLALDITVPTYVVTWQEAQGPPLFQESGGYPVHICHAQEPRHAP